MNGGYLTMNLTCVRFFPFILLFNALLVEIVSRFTLFLLYGTSCGMNGKLRYACIYIFT